MRTDVHFVYAACVTLAMTGCASKGKANAMSAAASGPGASTDVVGETALNARTPATGAGATMLAPIAGVTRAVAQLPRRVPIRWSESTGTTYAWRLEIGCDEGRGGIMRNDLSTPESFRGDGVFAGWSSAELAKVYRNAMRSFEVPAEAAATIQLD